MKGVTFTNSLKGKKAALKRAVFFYCLISVLRAGWNETAAGGSIGRDVLLVKPDEKKAKLFHSASSTGFTSPSLPNTFIIEPSSSEKDASAAFDLATSTMS